MRLLLFPFIPAELVSALEQASIKTDSDLMFATSTADILRKIAPGIVTLAELNHIKEQVIAMTSANGVRGDILLELELSRREEQPDFMSGIHDLDALLDGFGDSRIFEVSGEKASGKTVSLASFILAT